MKKRLDNLYCRAGRASRFVLRQFRSLIDRSRKYWFISVGAKRYMARARTALPGPQAPKGGRIYVDISVICRSDAATGIQRVVRSVAFLLAKSGKESGRPDPIFVYAEKNRHQIVHLQGENYVLTEECVDYAAGDIFLGLDYALDALWRMRKQLLRMRHAGVRFWYVVHDLLPLTHPHWFSPPTVLRFPIWLAILAATGDGFFCVSSPVEQELRAILQSRFGRDANGPDGYQTVVIPMGWDMTVGTPTLGLREDFTKALEALQNAPSLLVVGTVEPRKGHAEALDAMERLWADGSEIRLLLVGGVGWKTQALCARLEGHREAGQRLLLLGKVSDEALDQLYRACSGVLVPSLAEGFGLPVVEAIGRGKRVLARDLPVFAQHAGKGVTYFCRNASTQQLADAIHLWLAGLDNLDPPRPDLLATWDHTVNIIDTTLQAEFGR